MKRSKWAQLDGETPVTTGPGDLNHTIRKLKPTIEIKKEKGKMNDLFNNWTSTRTYASEENLLKAIAKLGLSTQGMLVVQVPGTDRLTAIFGKSFLGDAWMRAVHNGFKVIG